MTAWTSAASAVLRGRAHLILGNLFDAAENAARALQLLGPTDHWDRAGALLLLGDVGVAQMNDDLASESYREMELVLRGMQPSREVARMWRSLGDSLRDRRQHRRCRVGVRQLVVDARPEREPHGQPVARRLVRDPLHLAHCDPWVTLRATNRRAPTTAPTRPPSSSCRRCG